MPRIIVYHARYSCDSGCCGHVIETPDLDHRDDGYRHEFAFGHPYGEDHRQWAEEEVRRILGDEHVKDLDWENCRIQED